jgi:hypothetical protein
VLKDGYLIVLIQHFQIIYARQVATSGNPIQCLLFIPSSSLGNKLEIVGEELSEFAGIFMARPSCHAFHASVTEDISILSISKMARLYYSDT